MFLETCIVAFRNMSLKETKLLAQEFQKLLCLSCPQRICEPLSLKNPQRANFQHNPQPLWMTSQVPSSAIAHNTFIFPQRSSSVLLNSITLTSWRLPPSSWLPFRLLCQVACGYVRVWLQSLLFFGRYLWLPLSWETDRDFHIFFKKCPYGWLLLSAAPAIKWIKKQKAYRLQPSLASIKELESSRYGTRRKKIFCEQSYWRCNCTMCFTGEVRLFSLHLGLLAMSTNHLSGNLAYKYKTIKLVKKCCKISKIQRKGKSEEACEWSAYCIQAELVLCIFNV